MSALSAGDQRPEKRSHGKADTAVEDLGEIVGLGRQRQIERSKLRSADFGNDAVAFVEVGLERLPEMVLLQGTVERL